MTSCVLTVVSRSHEEHHGLLRKALDALRTEYPKVKIRRSRKSSDATPGIYISVKQKQPEVLDRLTELLFNFFAQIIAKMVLIVQKPHGITVTVLNPA